MIQWLRVRLACVGFEDIVETSLVCVIMGLLLKIVNGGVYLFNVPEEGTSVGRGCGREWCLGNAAAHRFAFSVLDILFAHATSLHTVDSLAKCAQLM